MTIARQDRSRISRDIPRVCFGRALSAGLGVFLVVCGVGCGRTPAQPSDVTAATPFGEAANYTSFDQFLPGPGHAVAHIFVGLKNSDDVGIRFDLRMDIVGILAGSPTPSLLGSSMLTSEPGGSSGFNNARPRHFMAEVSADPAAGDVWQITFLVRNACTGSGKNSGVARLWYNDGAAHSEILTAGLLAGELFLREGFALGSIGAGPKKTIDVQAGPKCSDFKPFGTWTTTFAPVG